MKTKLILILSVFLLATACGKKSAATGDAGCSDLDAMSARMRCTNNNLEFCSSYSKYKWTQTQKCDTGKTCFVAPDGKSGGCK